MPEPNAAPNQGATGTPPAATETKPNEGQPTISPELDKLLSEKLAEKAKELEDAAEKKWQAKFDKKNTEFQLAKKDAEEARKAQMSAEQRAEYEREQKALELKEREEQIRVKELDSFKSVRIAEKDIPIDMREFITGNSQEEIEKRIDLFKKKFDESVAKEAEKRMKSGSANPQNSGGAPAASNRQTLIEKINKAKQEGRVQDALKLQNQLAQLPKE